MENEKSVPEDLSSIPDEEFWDLIQSLGEVPALDALRIHKELGRRQQYNGMTAAEFQHASAPPAEEWAVMAKEHREYLRDRRILKPLYFRIGYIALGLVAWMVYDSARWPLWVVGVFVLMDIATSVRDDGYIEGLRAGVYEGVVRGRGLTQDEIDDFNKINRGLF